jgi:beta-aspartyl-peptidase (threonine type)
MELITGIVLAVHGGAGRDVRREEHTPEREAAYRRGLVTALRTGYEMLTAGGSALDAVEAAVRMMEDDPYFNAARGASLSHAGLVELDASVMDGKTGGAGAVAGVTTIKNPVTLARAVMERSPYVMLVGEGAEEFARKEDLEIVENGYFVTPERRAQYERLLLLRTGGIVDTAEGKRGTVGAVARDAAGNLAAAPSTGGIAGKRYGRVGDSPIIGAGTWAENATCAVSATGHGEYFIRNAVAHDIAARIAYAGQSVAEAANEVVLRKLVALGGEGGVIVLDAHGNAALPFNTPGMYRGFVTEDGTIHTAIFTDETL